MTRDDHSSSTNGTDRRNVLRTIGVAGASIAGVGSLTGVANAKEADSNTYICPNFTCSSGGGGDNFDMNVRLVQDYVTKEEACALLAAGCGVATVFAAADPVPYDAVIIAKACAVETAGCTVWAVFSDKHGNRPATVFRAQESAGKLDNGDYIMVPAAWNWKA